MSYNDLVEYRVAQNKAVKEYRKAKKQCEQISLNSGGIMTQVLKIMKIIIRVNKLATID